MAEQTLTNPLSGAEVIEAILDRLRNSLKADCHLNANSAYDWFSAEVSVKLDMHDTGAHIKVDRIAKVHNGVYPSDDVQHVEADFHIDPAPPNEVRIESGQPVHVLTKDEQGKDVVKGVRYARGTAKRVAKALAIIFVLTGLAHSQSTPSVAQPELSETEKIALNAVQQQYKRVSDEVTAIQQAQSAIVADIAKSHPGWRLDLKTGTLVKVVAEKQLPTKK